MSRICVIATEPSADLLASYYLRDIKATEFFGVGGHHLKAMGCDVWLDAKSLSCMGLLSVLKKILIIKRYQKMICRWLDSRPDVLVTVDAYDFCLPLWKHAKRLGIPVVHLVAPKVWATRANRAQVIMRWVDHLCVQFPFEKKLFSPQGRVHCIGHPMVDYLTKPVSYMHDAGIALLPGSRRQEIYHHLPVLLDAWHAYQERFSQARAKIVLPVSIDPVLKAWVQSQSGDIPVLCMSIDHAVEDVSCALVCAGTAALELAYLGVPMLVIYRTRWLEAKVIRFMMHTSKVALPNILLGKEVVKECLQEACTEAQLLQFLLEMHAYPSKKDMMREAFKEIRGALAGDIPYTKQLTSLFESVDQKK